VQRLQPGEGGGGAVEQQYRVDRARRTADHLRLRGTAAMDVGFLGQLAQSVQQSGGVRRRRHRRGAVLQLPHGMRPGAGARAARIPPTEQCQVQLLAQIVEYVRVGGVGERRAIERIGLEAGEGLASPGAGAQDDRHQDGIAGIAALDRSLHLDGTAIPGRHKIRADQQQNDIGALQLAADLAVPIVTRHQLAVVPRGDALLRFKRPHRGDHTVLPRLVAM